MWDRYEREARLSARQAEADRQASAQRTHKDRLHRDFMPWPEFLATCKDRGTPLEAVFQAIKDGILKLETTTPGTSPPLAGLIEPPGLPTFCQKYGIHFSFQSIEQFFLEHPPGLDPDPAWTRAENLRLQAELERIHGVFAMNPTNLRTALAQAQADLARTRQETEALRAALEQAERSPTNEAKAEQWKQSVKAIVSGLARHLFKPEIQPLKKQDFFDCWKEAKEAEGVYGTAEEAAWQGLPEAMRNKPGKQKKRT